MELDQCLIKADYDGKSVISAASMIRLVQYMHSPAAWAAWFTWAEAALNSMYSLLPCSPAQPEAAICSAEVLLKLALKPLMGP